MLLWTSMISGRTSFFLYGVVALLVLMGCILVLKSSVFSRHSDLESEIHAIVACTKQSDSISCARPLLRDLVGSESGAQVMQVLSDNLTSGECHTMGHVVGQEVYAKYHSVEPALAECSNACFSACVHGVVGEAFVEEAGLPKNVDPEHLSRQEILAVGSKLCTSQSACHGVGHALFLATAAIAPSLSDCSQITSGASAEFCFSGVFMEYGDELSSQSAWKDSPAVAYPPASALASFCDQSSPDERLACFEYFPSVAFETLLHTGSATSTSDARRQLKRICESFPDTQARGACILGYGMYFSGLVLTDQTTALKVCEGFSALADKNACVLGMVYRADQYNKTDTVLSYCAAVSSALRLSCYTDVFAVLFQSDGSVSEARKLCPAGDALCPQGADRYKQNLWGVFRAPAR
jgi:hypothetical protein